MRKDQILAPGREILADFWVPSKEHLFLRSYMHKIKILSNSEDLGRYSICPDHCTMLHFDDSEINCPLQGQKFEFVVWKLVVGSGE